MAKVRIDVYLVQKGYAPSRTKAQDLIKEGSVYLNEKGKSRIVLSANELISEESFPDVLILPNAVEKFVSRAGLKMEGALRHLGLRVDQFRVLDVGISTGGFTDCLLQHGVQSVVGVDVGRNQLNLKLKNDPRVSLLEGVNARDLQNHPEVQKRMPTGGFDLAVIDVSFISLKLVLPSVLSLVSLKGHVLALVKPQFEVGPENLGKNGVVTDSTLYEKLRSDIYTLGGNLGYLVKDYFESSIEGKDGNREFFVFIQKS